MIHPDLLWIAGGYLYEEDVYTQSSILLNADLESSPGPDLPHRYTKGHCIARVNESHLFLHGGEDGADNFTSSAYLLEWESGEWTRLADGRYYRAQHICGRAGNSMVSKGA